MKHLCIGSTGYHSERCALLLLFVCVCVCVCMCVFVYEKEREAERKNNLVLPIFLVNVGQWYTETQTQWLP